MNTWKVIIATLVIFGAGVITGGLLVSYSDRAMHHTNQRPVANNQWNGPGQPNPMGQPGPRVPAPMPGPLRKDFLDRLDRELTLTSVQRDRIERIISEGQERTREVWQTVEPDVRRELMGTRERIRNELTPDQRVHFEEIMRRPQRRPEDMSTNRPMRDLRDQRRGMPPRTPTNAQQ